MSKKSKKDVGDSDTKPLISDLPGVGPSTQEGLIGAGYNTIQKIADAAPSKLAENVDGVGEATAKKIIKAAQKMAKATEKPKKDTTATSKKPAKKTKETPQKTERKPKKAPVDIPLKELPGVGAKTRDELIKSGYDSVVDISEASPTQLAEEVDGVGDVTSKKIVKAAKSMVKDLEKKKPTKKPSAKAEVPARPPKKSKKPKKTVVKKTEKTEDEPTGRDALVKSRIFRLAQEKKQRSPSFRNVQAHRWVRVKDSWRKARGIDSAAREKRKGRPPMVNTGYRTPKAVRNLHPSGYEEVLVHRPDDLEGLNPDIHAIRIGGTVGIKKRQDIIKKADTMLLRVLNPGAPDEIMEEDLFSELDVLDEMEVE